MNNAIFDLPQTRLCAAVVLAWGYEDQLKFKNATKALQAELGNGWSSTSAFQFMSGATAKAALDTAGSEEQISLLIAYSLAKLVCNELGLGAVNKPDHIDRAELMAAISAKH
ncbi:hypothetical protein A1353_18980 [Methylomonas methanica]|uniref:Uncharacterized protein n=1 Tax=Methylomonas methanica TaxID=421 RepID=A0A177M586_METMH|nr:hypothetical protein [Methylomonas methanica]OAI00896.1 hypothetical protein A1353_18980 [Methylomonas methanica]